MIIKSRINDFSYSWFHTWSTVLEFLLLFKNIRNVSNLGEREYNKVLSKRKKKKNRN